MHRCKFQLLKGLAFLSLRLNISYKGDVLLEFSSVKWVLNEDYSFYSNLMGTLLLQNFALVNSYFINFFVGPTTVEIEGIRFM